MTTYSPAWLGRYGSGYYAWTASTSSSSSSSPPASVLPPTPPAATTPTQPPTYTRRLGTTEHSFHLDGTLFTGRADVNSLFTLSLTTSFPVESIRERVLWAWACLRAGRGLLRATVAEDDDGGPRFCVRSLETVEEAVGEARGTVVFLEKDEIGEEDVGVFWKHAMNTARVIEPGREMAKLFVLPLEELSDDTSTTTTSQNGNPKTLRKYKLHTLLTASHAITDGLSTYTFHAALTHLLNTPLSSLRKHLESLTTLSCTAAHMLSSLPPAQEDLYTRPRGSIARQRWAWAITRILRHVRRPPPAGFTNPLRRDVALSAAEEMPRLFPKTLDYDTLPPLNSYTAALTLSPAATKRLTTLCRGTNSSIGAGAFVLVALSLMSFYEQRFPDVPARERKPFVGHFPVDPRGFFDSTIPGAKRVPESMMLAFSDGVVLPFLPSHLPLEGRFKLLVRQASRQLRVFQKRGRSAQELVELGSRSPNQLLPLNYLSLLERLASKLPPSSSSTTTSPPANPQGAYPASLPSGPGTCGVSSIGALKGVRPERAFEMMEDEEVGGVFAANWIGLRNAVRVREGEFLVGVAAGESAATPLVGTQQEILKEEGVLQFNVSYDGNALNPTLVSSWTLLISQILEGNAGDIAAHEGKSRTRTRDGPLRGNL